MKWEEVEERGRRMLLEYGLRDWSIIKLRTKKTAGNCNRTHKRVGISKAWSDVNDWPAVEEILIHEVAHAITTGGHNDLWREMFKKMGGSGSRVIPPWVQRPVSPMYMRCMVCHREQPIYRKPKRARYCVECWQGGKGKTSALLVVSRRSHRAPRSTGR